MEGRGGGLLEVGRMQARHAGKQCVCTHVCTCVFSKPILRQLWLQGPRAKRKGMGQCADMALVLDYCFQIGSIARALLVHACALTQCT